MLASLIERLEAEIARFGAYLLAQPREPVELLALSLMRTAPGIDLIGAALLLVEIGVDMSEFKSPDAIARWAGVCPPNNKSAETHIFLAHGRPANPMRTPGNKLEGNTYVRRLLCEFALAATKTRRIVQAKYKSLTIGTGTNERSSPAPTR